MDIIAAAAAQAAEDAAAAHDDSSVEEEHSSEEEIEVEAEADAEDEEEPPAADAGQPAETVPSAWADSITLQQQVAWGWLRHQHSRGHGLFAKNFR